MNSLNRQCAMAHCVCQVPSTHALLVFPVVLTGQKSPLVSRLSVVDELVCRVRWHQFVFTSVSHNMIIELLSTSVVLT